MTDREPVAQRVNSMISTLEEIISIARNDDTRAEVAAEEVGLAKIAFRANLILSFLDTYKPAKLLLIGKKRKA